MPKIPDVCSAVFVFIVTDQHLNGSEAVSSLASRDAAGNLNILISTRVLQFLNVPTGTCSQSTFCVHVLSPLY
jgi:hypothetical protein